MKLSEILKEAGAPQAQIDAALETEKDLASVKNESADRRRELTTLNEKMKTFDGIDLEALQKSQKALAKIEEDNDLKAGEFDKIRTKLETDHTAALEKVTTGRDNWKNKYKSLAVDKGLLSAAAHHKAIDPDEVVMLTKGNVYVDDETGAMTIREGGKDGKELTDDDGKALNLEGYVGQFLSKKAHLVQGSGGGAGSGGGQGGGGENKDQSSKGKISRGLVKKEGTQ